MKRLLLVSLVVLSLVRAADAQQSNRGFYRGGLSSGYILFFVHTNGALAVYTSDFGQTTSGGGSVSNTGFFSFNTISPNQTTSSINGTLASDSVSGNFTPNGSPIEAFTATKVPIFGPTANVAGRYFGVCHVQPAGIDRPVTILLDSQGRLVINGIGNDSISNVTQTISFPESFGADLLPEFSVPAYFSNVTGPSTNIYVGHGVMEGTFIAGSVTYQFRASKESSANHLANISTRGFVNIDTGVGQLIAGFIITGGPKLVLIRALGPSLFNGIGVYNYLQNPMVQLFGSSGQAPLAVNDDWQTNSNASDIVATTIPPRDPKESALLVRLEPGPYTAVVSGADGGSGAALVEVYEIDRD